MTDDMLGPSPMHIKYSSYVYDGFCIRRTNFPGPIESVISKFTCKTLVAYPVISMLCHKCCQHFFLILMYFVMNAELSTKQTIFNFLYLFNAYSTHNLLTTIPSSCIIFHF